MTDSTGASRAGAGLAAQPAARINRYGMLGLKAAALMVLGLMLFFQFHSRRFLALTTAPAMDAAQVARSWAEGGKPNSLVLRPIELRTEKAVGTHTDRLNAPLYIAVLAAVFHAREDASDLAVVTTNGLLHLLSALLFYFCARHVLGSRAAALGTVLFLSSVSLIGAALDGAGLSLAMLLLLAALYAVLQLYPAHGRAVDWSRLAAPRRVRLWQALSGVLMGLAFLAGHIALLLLLPVVWMAARPPFAAAREEEAPSEPRAARRRRGLVGLAAALIPAAAVMVVGLVAFHGLPLRPALLSPLKQSRLLMNTATYPGDTIMMVPPEAGAGALRFAATHPKQIAQKLARGVTSIYSAIPQIWGLYLLPLALLAGLAFSRGSLGWRLWGVLLVMVVLQGFTIALYSGDTDDVAVVLPLALLVGTGALWWVLTEHLQGRLARGAVGAVAIVLLTFPYVSSAVLGGKVVRPVQRSGATIRSAVQIMGMDLQLVLASDVPEAVAWWGNRRAVQLPPDYNGIKSLQASGVQPGAIFLSSAVGSLPPRGHPLSYWRPYVAMNPQPNAVVVFAERTPEGARKRVLPLQEFEKQFDREKQAPLGIQWPVRLLYGTKDKPKEEVALLMRLEGSGDVLLGLPPAGSQQTPAPKRPGAS